MAATTQCSVMRTTVPTSTSVTKRADIPHIGIPFNGCKLGFPDFAGSATRLAINCSRKKPAHWGHQSSSRDPHRHPPAPSRYKSRSPNLR